MKNKHKFFPYAGFTLIEASIVLVIVALIIAAIMGGQNLIENSERQAVAREIQKLEAAMTSFKQQYDQIAGDMDNASDYWSGADNGNGNAFVESFEEECQWVKNHLKLAEIYEGVLNNSGNYNIKSTIDGGFYQLCSSLNTGFENELFGTSNGHLIYDTYLNYIMLANKQGGEGVVNSTFAQSVDDKIDDGKASSGNLVAIRGEGSTSGTYATSGCVTGDGDGFTDSGSEGTINYDTDDNTKNCRLIFLLKGLN